MRIYITSRNRTPASASPSDFQFALERPIELPEGATGSIDSFTCSNVWEAVLPTVNQKVYYQYNYMAQQTLELEPGDLINVTALAAKLTTAIQFESPLEPAVTVTAVWEPIALRVSWTWRWPALHACLSPNLELRPFRVYATCGGLGRCLRPGGGDD